jgi:hypothetical protein
MHRARIDERAKVRIKSEHLGLLKHEKGCTSNWGVSNSSFVPIALTVVVPEVLIVKGTT